MVIVEYSNFNVPYIQGGEKPALTVPYGYRVMGGWNNKSSQRYRTIIRPKAGPI